MYGDKPQVVAIHAGLECGLLCEKIENLDAVSIGPNMMDIHTPREKISVASVERVYKYLLRLLEVL
jgi:dipeptidase D